VHLRPLGPGHREVEDEGLPKLLSRHGGCLFRSGCEPDFEGAPKIVLADSAEEREELTSVTMDPRRRRRCARFREHYAEPHVQA
jgi:hypothetical protein